MVRVIKRRCAVCGKDLTIKVYHNGRYEGGHYFGNLKEELKEIGEYNPSIPDEEYEYWECDKCYRGER